MIFSHTLPQCVDIEYRCLHLLFLPGFQRHQILQYKYQNQKVFFFMRLYIEFFSPIYLPKVNMHGIPSKL